MSRNDARLSLLHLLFLDFYCPFVPLFAVRVIWEMIGSQSIDTPIGQCFTFEGRLLTKLINHGNPQNTEKMSV